jgi:hypothetical protein
MHAALENAAKALGLDLPNLEEAAAFSDRVLAQIQAALHKRLPLLAEESSVDYFIEQFRMPALARLAQLEPDLENDSKADLALVLTIADELVGHLKDETFRNEAKRVEAPSKVPKGSRFEAVRDRALELQESLERIFFESALLRANSIRYLSF